MSYKFPTLKLDEINNDDFKIHVVDKEFYLSSLYAQSVWAKIPNLGEP